MFFNRKSKKDSINEDFLISSLAEMSIYLWRQQKILDIDNLLLDKPLRTILSNPDNIGQFMIAKLMFIISTTVTLLRQNQIQSQTINDYVGLLSSIINESGELKLTNSDIDYLAERAKEYSDSQGEEIMKDQSVKNTEKLFSQDAFGKHIPNTPHLHKERLGLQRYIALQAQGVINEARLS